MTEPRDTILIVDDDIQARTLLREQVFSTDQFTVVEANDGPEGLTLLKRHQPDLVILDLILPGLTGYDMLVAFRSQGHAGPLIVLDEPNSTRSVVEAFRLGASDYITKPLREAEVLAAVERGLDAVRLRRERDGLITRLQSTNRQLEMRIKELTTLYDTGETVASMADLESLLERVLEGAITVTEADHSILLLRDERTGKLILRAGKNMRLVMLDRLGEPIQDQLADLVMTSREPLAASGDSLRRFTLAKDLFAVAYAPLSVQNNPIGVLAVGNHETHQPFNENHTRLLKALADYAAIAIVNARLYTMLQQRAHAMERATRQLQDRDAERGRQLKAVLDHFIRPLTMLDAELNRLATQSKTQDAELTAGQLRVLSQNVKNLIAQVNRLAQRALDAPPKPPPGR